MGISSTKRGIRTQAANQAYLDNWEANFGGGCCGTNRQSLKEQYEAYKKQVRDIVTQDIEVAEIVLRELGYEKKKAPTPVTESRPYVPDPDMHGSYAWYSDTMYPKH